MCDIKLNQPLKLSWIFDFQVMLIYKILILPASISKI